MQLSPWASWQHNTTELSDDWLLHGSALQTRSNNCTVSLT